MKSKQVNQIMYTAGTLLLAAFAVYLFKWDRIVLDTLLIIATPSSRRPHLYKSMESFATEDVQY